MPQMYLILGSAGWIWQAIVVAYAVGYFKGERDGKNCAGGDLEK